MAMLAHLLGIFTWFLGALIIWLLRAQALERTEFRLDDLAAAVGEHAHQSIHLAPEHPFGQYTLAQIMLRRNRFDEAQAAIMEAIRLNPYDADYFAILASLHLRASRWREALAVADQGLAVEPEHALCTNLRAQALVRLELDGERVVREERMLRGIDQRIRHVRQGPDGFVYLLTDESDGGLLRLEPR